MGKHVATIARGGFFRTDVAVRKDTVLVAVASGGPSGGVPPKCNPDISAVPLPASLPLMLAGLGGLGMIARRKKKGF